MKIRSTLRTITLTLCLMGGVSMAGGPTDHAIQAFQHFAKPLDKITVYDRVWATIDHAKTDGLVAENGKNLIIYQSAFGWIAYQKAKAIGMGKQFKMSALYGNLPDIIDKGLTGGVIASQLEQIPFIGETLAMIVPSMLHQEILHSIKGWPTPSYSMTEEQYFWFQVVEVSLFWLSCDAVKFKANTAYIEVAI